MMDTWWWSNFTTAKASESSFKIMTHQLASKNCIEKIIIIKKKRSVSFPSNILFFMSTKLFLTSCRYLEWNCWCWRPHVHSHLCFMDFTLKQLELDPWTERPWPMWGHPGRSFQFSCFVTKFSSCAPSLLFFLDKHSKKGQLGDYQNATAHASSELLGAPLMCPTTQPGTPW